MPPETTAHIPAMARRYFSQRREARFFLAAFLCCFRDSRILNPDSC
jgi:hypothetical protein